MNAAQARIKAVEILKGNPFVAAATPELDASILLSKILGVSRTMLLAHPEIGLTREQEKDFISQIEMRLQGTPIAYITQEKEFWGLRFRVTPAVLIPKPDTEILVERACGIVQSIRIAHPGAPIRVLDVCTGSGCIAIAVKRSCPYAEVSATDISGEALEIARENSRALVDDEVSFIQGDLRQGLPRTQGGWSLVVSNPPYVPSLVARSLLEDGRGEPLSALDGGSDGLDLVRALVPAALDVLAPNSRILIESGEYNASETARILKSSGFTDIVIHKDLENQDRVAEGKSHDGIP